MKKLLLLPILLLTMIACQQEDDAIIIENVTDVSVLSEQSVGMDINSDGDMLDTLVPTYTLSMYSIDKDN